MWHRQPAIVGAGLSRVVVVGSCFVLACLVTPAASQTVRVRVAEAETKRPIGGAIVSLVDSTDRRVAQSLTNESGRASLRSPIAGGFRIRADRIGHPGVWSERFDLRDTLTIELQMPLEWVALPELTVHGSTSCQRRVDGDQTAILWEEIHKALSAGQITAAAGSIDLAVRRFHRYRTASLAVRVDSTIDEHRTRASPFVSPDPATLRTAGYIRKTATGWQFHGPDALTLLSPEFLESHCFERVVPKDNAPLVGLGFYPAKDIAQPDVRGALWVDRVTLELSYLEFEFVDAPAAVQAPGIGGRVDFQRLATGAWIIRDWYIRTPEWVAVERRGLEPGQIVVHDSLAGYLDVGGTARPVGDPTIALGEAAARVRNAPTTSGDFRGRVVTPEGNPIAGASIAVAESDSVLTTNGDGRFEAVGLPTGRFAIRIRAIGFRPYGAVLRLSGERRLLDTTLVLTRAAQLLDSVVVTAKAPFESGKMIDVERRRQLGFGRFLTRERLAARAVGTGFGRARVARNDLRPLSPGRRGRPTAPLRPQPPAGCSSADRLKAGEQLLALGKSCHRLVAARLVVPRPHRLNDGIVVGRLNRLGGDPLKHLEDSPVLGSHQDRDSIGGQGLGPEDRDMIPHEGHQVGLFASLRPIGRNHNNSH